MRMPRRAHQAACALVKAVDGVKDKGFRVCAEHGNHLIAQRGAFDVNSRQRGKRRALGDDQNILVLIADEGGRGRGFAAVFFCRSAVFFYGCAFCQHVAGQMDFDYIALAEDVICAYRRAVDKDGGKHLEPAEGMRAEGKTARYHGADCAPVIRSGGCIG